MSILRNLNGFYIIVVPDTKRQNRTHKRKRINKKWAKRYDLLHITHWRMEK